MFQTRPSPNPSPPGESSPIDPKLRSLQDAPRGQRHAARHVSQAHPRPRLGRLAVEARRRAGVQVERGAAAAVGLGERKKGAALAWEKVGKDGTKRMINLGKLRPFGMIPLINHDSSEVAVRSL